MDAASNRVVMLGQLVDAVVLLNVAIRVTMCGLVCESPRPSVVPESQRRRHAKDWAGGIKRWAQHRADMRDHCRPASLRHEMLNKVLVEGGGQLIADESWLSTKERSS